MEFPPSAHPLPAPMAKPENRLWCPGSSFYANPPREGQTEPTHMARLHCQQELQKLYENTPEASYDLSLKDIVDPWITISGNLKSMVAEEELRSHAQGLSDGKSKGWRSPPMPKLSFSFSFPGLSAKSKRPPSPSFDASASKQCLRANVSTSLFAKRSPEARTSSSSKIHPSSQCSSCSSLTIFFKTRCLVCGRLYCSICAKERMDHLSSGFKCKGPCKSDPFRKRISHKMASKCWPMWSGFDVTRSKHKTTNVDCKQEIVS